MVSKGSSCGGGARDSWVPWLWLTLRYQPVNFLNLPPEVDQSNTEGVTEDELKLLEKQKGWRVTGTAYAMEHAFRPATIGLVLSTSPLALLAWIGEKLLEWADTPLPLETTLRMISLYWFTSSGPRCIYPYRAIFGAAQPGISTTKPLGYSAFKDLGVVPEAWSKHFPNMKFRRAHSEVSDPGPVLRGVYPPPGHHSRAPLHPFSTAFPYLPMLTNGRNRVATSLRWSSQRPSSKISRSLWFGSLDHCR